MDRKHSHSRGHKHRKSSSSDHKFRKMRKHHMMEGMINHRVSKLVEEKIYSLMPCFVNQVHNCSVTGLQKIESAEGIVHEGIACSGCATNPINGIRYACPQCFKFNLCQVCEEKISHEHDLLKMRKPRGN